MIHRRVPSLKRTLGGKKALHEKFVLARSQEYCTGSRTDLELASFEFIYISNFANWIIGKNDLIDKVMDRVERKLTQLQIRHQSSDEDDKDFDQEAYLLLMKGVLLRLYGNQQQANEHFYRVLSMENHIKEEFHSPSLACFELGMYDRSQGDFCRAKDWLKKSCKYPSHFAEAGVHFRTELALQSMKKSLVGKQVKENKHLSQDHRSTFISNLF